jgi:hypothetical protein
MGRFTWMTIKVDLLPDSGLMGFIPLCSVWMPIKTGLLTSLPESNSPGTDCHLN